MSKLGVNKEGSLVTACEMGKLNEIIDLIKQGANPHLQLPMRSVMTNIMTSEIIEHPFTAAISSGHLRVMRYFMDKIKCNPLMAITEVAINYRVQKRTVKYKFDAVCVAIKHAPNTSIAHLQFVDCLLAKVQAKKKLDERAAKYQSYVDLLFIIFICPAYSHLW